MSLARRAARAAALAGAVALAGCNSPIPGGEGGDGAGGRDLAMSSGCPACPAGAPHCNPQGKCVACLADADCPSGQICKSLTGGAVACTAGCNDDARCKGGNAMSPLACCDHKCLDTTRDPANCGGCGMACSSVHSSSVCKAGQCALSGQCDPGFGDCNMDPKDGCEANLHVDPGHCGACATKCAIPNAVSACADGCYMAACTFGFGDCNGDPMDGCETSVLSDGANCGACGNSCAGLPHASAGCMNAQCVLGKCDPGYVDCNGDPKDGCETNLMSDAKNCAKCGVVCPMNAPYCAGGVCQNGCVNGHPVPDACVTGKDPETMSPWVVCTADCSQAWIANATNMGGMYHALQICQGLGYTTLGKFGGTCGNVCGYCEGMTSCMKPGKMNFDGAGAGCAQDKFGAIYCSTVHWQCLK